MHFKIESDDGNVYEGGILDTVEVKGKGRISLAEVTEEDDIIPGSLQNFTWNHSECFEELRDYTLEDEAKDPKHKAFGNQLIEEYGDISNEWRKKYGVPLKEESVLPVRKTRATINGTSIMVRPVRPQTAIKVRKTKK
jgi:hypothetical protein